MSLRHLQQDNCRGVSGHAIGRAEGRESVHSRETWNAGPLSSLSPLTLPGVFRVCVCGGGGGYTVCLPPP